MSRHIRPRFAMLLSLAFIAGAPAISWAQGCVVARGAGISPVHAPPDGDGAATIGRWQASMAYRNLHSDRHFVGSQEQHHRRQEGSEVINNSNFVDLSFTYAVSERLSATLTCPYADHDRSSVVRDQERNILARYHTQNSGFADLRLTANYWAFDPKTHANGNVSLGFGIDLPTGKEDARDVFQSYDAATGQIVGVRRTVDQSIQLGDGGWGLLLDVFAYRHLAPRLSVFANAFYAITPEETNGVPTFRSNPFESEMAIADSYMARAGFDYVLWPRFGMTASLGARIEGVPVHDLVGGSDGFRRPGYAVSIEPGVTAMFGATSASLYAPLAVYRNRERSVADRRYTESSGIYRHGDAAFADGLLMFNVSRTF